MGGSVCAIGLKQPKREPRPRLTRSQDDPQSGDGPWCLLRRRFGFRSRRPVAPPMRSCPATPPSRHDACARRRQGTARPDSRSQSQARGQRRTVRPFFGARASRPPGPHQARPL